MNEGLGEMMCACPLCSYLCKRIGKTILIASHNPLDIEILCNDVYEMDGGVLEW